MEAKGIDTAMNHKWVGNNAIKIRMKTLIENKNWIQSQKQEIQKLGIRSQNLIRFRKLGRRIQNWILFRKLGRKSQVDLKKCKKRWNKAVPIRSVVMGSSHLKIKTIKFLRVEILKSLKTPKNSPKTIKLFPKQTAQSKSTRLILKSKNLKNVYLSKSRKWRDFWRSKKLNWQKLKCSVKNWRKKKRGRRSLKRKNKDCWKNRKEFGRRKFKHRSMPNWKLKGKKKSDCSKKKKWLKKSDSKKSKLKKRDFKKSKLKMLDLRKLN